MRKWRVGSISTGIFFILLGVLLLINQVWGIQITLGLYRVQAIGIIPAENTNARIDASSEVGSVDGDINWVIKKGVEPVGSKKEATLGSGKYKVNLENNNGSIEVNME
ncbi:hypothetical protein [Tepidibacillus marianensis]|uniref:hypothetical protein n=1 Tax=Tepidibacillus marianensis TaxID=3131995 RepID=UPI0030D31CB4